MEKEIVYGWLYVFFKINPAWNK